MLFAILLILPISRTFRKSMFALLYFWYFWRGEPSFHAAFTIYTGMIFGLSPST
jgi:hypothetical protein